MKNKINREVIYKGFSLVEVLAAVAIIGIITFLAIPNIVAVKQDSETNMAISRAEALNIAMVSYVQANGHDNASDYWGNEINAQGRYALLASYLAFAPSNLFEYMPSGYQIKLPGDLRRISKVHLTGPYGEIYY
ncbi:type II secretion system GspH family protein [Verrucomicrobia bacterium]|nr:type II secretion system GspH family protein [Verrucomicrobiota bacterium]